MEMGFLEKLVKKIRKTKKDADLYLMTNGIKFNELSDNEIIKFLKNFKVVSISVSNERYRVLNGVGIKAVKKIIKLKKEKKVHPEIEIIFVNDGVSDKTIKGIYNSLMVPSFSYKKYKIWTPEDDKASRCRFDTIFYETIIANGLNILFDGQAFLPCCSFETEKMYPLVDMEEVRYMREKGINATQEAVDRYEKLAEMFMTVDRKLSGKRAKIYDKGCAHCKKVGAEYREKQMQKQAQKQAILIK